LAAAPPLSSGFRPAVLLLLLSATNLQQRRFTPDPPDNLVPAGKHQDPHPQRRIA
jgi:hypothetical protein